MPKRANISSGRQLILSFRKNNTRKGARAFCSTKIDTYEPTSGAHPDVFANRHIGPRNGDIAKLLEQLNVASLSELMEKTLPHGIRIKSDAEMDQPLSELELAVRARVISLQNDAKDFYTYIGMGYYNTITPTVIQRNMIENPGWYTPYTPYQPEISQGRLQSLLNWQTMIQDLTGLTIANGSLLDEGTAAGEALGMAYKAYPKKMAVFLDEKMHPQTIAVVKTRASGFGIRVDVGKVEEADIASGQYCGVMFQYPDTEGVIKDFSEVTKVCKEAETLSICATDPLALCKLKPPGEFGCDVALGCAQRFGVPLGYGGPHAAFFACSEEHVRRLPGRLVGKSIDSSGNTALRLTLTTREQHIRRDKATSNICTAQALLANIAAMYAIYHGPKGLQRISSMVHDYTRALAHGVQSAGMTVLNDTFFDTLAIDAGSKKEEVWQRALQNKHNFRDLGGSKIGLSMDETLTPSKLEAILKIFGSSLSMKDCWDAVSKDNVFNNANKKFGRQSEILTHDVFNAYHSEHLLTRYMKKLENKDFSLVHSMAPLGSCTMKLNATSEMLPISLRGFNSIHPFVPKEQAKGYEVLLEELEKDLKELTGYAGFSFQPNSGSQGEYAGLRAIDAYHKSRGDSQRHVCVIPKSAHGTNPASAQMAGLKVVPMETDKEGNVDNQALTKLAEQHKGKLSAVMLTYPSTFGVFEEEIKEIADIVHHYGGQFYLDGANMNALTAYCRPIDFGADVCHLNMHKTFCIPHGGGGPGVGPIGVAEHLLPFLPSHPIISPSLPSSSPLLCSQSPGPVCSAPWGSASILPISWAFFRMMGLQGLKRSTEIAILNANYMKKRLENDYKILYVGKHGFCAHEFILDTRRFKKTTTVEAHDIAKRLQDFGFHAPTMSWPVANTLMIEPTESEDVGEMDRYIEALLIIRQEIRDIENGVIAAKDSPLKHAPHTAAVVTSDKWDRAYSRQVAAFPASFVKPATKLWPPVGRLNDQFGDLNLSCSCDKVEGF